MAPKNGTTSALQTEAEEESTLVSQPTPPVEPEPDPEPELPKLGFFGSLANRILGYTDEDRLAALQRQAETEAKQAAAKAQRERIGVRGAAAGLGANVYGSERHMEARESASELQNEFADMASLGVIDAISSVAGEDIINQQEKDLPARVLGVAPLAVPLIGRTLGRLPLVGKLFGKAADAPRGGLAANPFQGKTPQQIDELLTSRGFKKIGPDPMTGKGSYFHPESGRKYYVDPGGVYKLGTELPHVDVHRMIDGKNTEGIKRKYPLGDNLYE